MKNSLFLYLVWFDIRLYIDIYVDMLIKSKDIVFLIILFK